jgi:hypothetical protein
VGANGDTLVADSSATTGLRYQSGYNGNAVINGGMDIWQRGTSFTSASVYTADRWFKGSQANWTTSRQTSSLTGIQYALRLQRDSGNSSTTGCIMAYSIETADALRFADKTVVVSFYARAGANYSPTSSNFLYTLYTGTGTDQRRDQSTGFTGEATVATANVTLTTSWQRFSFTASIGSTATEIALTLGFVPTGTAGAADYADFTGVQIELGSAATTFKRAGGTIQGELAACQRYFTRIGGEVAYNFLANAYFDSTTTGFGMVNYSSMRTTPAATFTTASNYAALNIGTAVTACTAISADFYNTKSFRLSFTVGSARTAGQGLIMTSNNTTNGYIDISAEL